MPTTASGIVYPASSDAPRVWEDMADMANSIESLVAGLGVYQTFTPAFNSSSAPTYGTASQREGWFTRIGKMVSWGIRIEFGATGTPAFNGEMQFSLAEIGAPYNGDGTGPGSGLTTTLGSWNWRSNAGGLRHYGGSIGVYANGGNSAFFGGAYDGTAHRLRLGSTTGTPVALANSDIITAAGCYRLA